MSSTIAETPIADGLRYAVAVLGDWLARLRAAFVEMGRAVMRLLTPETDRARRAREERKRQEIRAAIMLRCAGQRRRQQRARGRAWRS